MANRKPTSAEKAFLMVWHGAFSGAFIVAYATAEASYGMHFFSGCVVLLALGLRLLVGLAAPKGTPLALPSISGSLDSLSRWTGGGAPGGKNPLYIWMAAGLLAATGIASVTGLVADAFGGDDLHEGTSEFALGLMFAHIALVMAVQGVKRLSRSAA